MASLSSSLEEKLRQIFRENVKFDRIERKMHSFDVGAMPKLVKPFLPVGIPGAVVRPQNDKQISKLAKLAFKEGIKLVPRGMSTSGLGGVLPTAGAVVVDLSGMNKILKIDEKKKIVKVQPGVIWQNLNKEVNKRELDLRLYPTSSPSSTVAGWLAQGGSGIGSFEYGTFKENVVSARVILPNGDAKEFEGDELNNYIADAEGITGIITEVTIMLRDLEPQVHRAISYNSAFALGAALDAISSYGLPVWSITVLNPESIKIKKRLPHKHGRPYEEANSHTTPFIPEAYIILLSYPESRKELVEEPLERILELNGGQELSKEAAEHEWDLRFSPMRLKRSGLSIIPAEVVVPTAKVSKVLDEIEEKVKQPFVLEAMAVKGDKTVLLGFIPHDERIFAFDFAFALALTIIEIAKKYGGSAYGTGLYFRREAKNVLGEEKVNALSEYKKKVDPHGIMNPNKVLGSGIIDLIMGSASAIEPVIRIFENAAKVRRVIWSKIPLRIARVTALMNKYLKNRQEPNKSLQNQEAASRQE